ncbi:energy-coupling factor ABC transporter ATP-binding protein [Mesoterricola sediminis]|uniref:ABC transporter ATP-binding protein n=1 Tax=Mesoterricola sediminis TaxID=2927980 RepID=A0AA48KCE7_9BACT|nr:ABC transporter ATP-binding protein [Mesoterricola sediminis]BDU77074.1 putative ABC transporter ATP-binding protein [Mesoterricola sediminis]
MSAPILEVRDLAYAYPDGTRALRGLAFALAPGERVAVVGANGAGKSTLLQHLNGTLLPAAGTVAVGGVPVAPAALDTVRRAVGMVFQDPDDQLFMPTVYEDVAFGPRNQGLPEAEVDARVRAALEQVDALRLAPKPPYRLSAGEKRRAALATALALEPDILVLDEPTSGLDPRGRRQLIEMLRAFPHAQLVATHDVDLVLELCPRTLVLHDGQLRADGPTLPLFRDADLLAACRLEKPLAMQGCPVCGR